MTRDPLTAHQRKGLEAIRTLTARHGRPPTQAMIAAEARIRWHKSVQDLLHDLEALGVITRTPGGRRSIRIAEGW